MFGSQHAHITCTDHDAFHPLDIIFQKFMRLCHSHRSDGDGILGNICCIAYFRRAFDCIGDNAVKPLSCRTVLKRETERLFYLSGDLGFPDDQ